MAQAENLYLIFGANATNNAPLPQLLLAIQKFYIRKAVEGLITGYKQVASFSGRWASKWVRSRGNCVQETGEGATSGDRGFEPAFCSAVCRVG